MRLVRRVVKIFIAMLVLLLVTMGIAYHFADQYFNRGRNLPKVLAVPASSFVQLPTKPYTGQHPRLLQRPVETFDFPLAEDDVGPVEPLFAAGPNYPYFCRTRDSRLGHPNTPLLQALG